MAATTDLWNSICDNKAQHENTKYSVFSCWSWTILEIIAEINAVATIFQVCFSQKSYMLEKWNQCELLRNILVHIIYFCAILHKF